VPTAETLEQRATRLKQWLEDQQRFHTQASETAGRTVRSGHRLGFVLFMVTVVMAILHVLHAGALAAFLALLLPVWAGVVHSSIAELELERIEARSAGLSRALHELRVRADAAESNDEIEEVIDETAELMSTESREWWTLLSFHDIRLHV